MWYSAVGSIVTLILSLLAVPLAAVAQPAGKVPTAVGRGGFVLVDTSERAYTVFMAIPEEKLHEVQSQVVGKQDVVLVAWSEFERKQGEQLSSRILKNEYKGSRVVDGILQLLDKYPGVPFGLTWNGGVAVTYNDYQYAKKTYATYRGSPEDYERTRVRDPRADPVKPEWHFGPLLGW